MPWPSHPRAEEVARLAVGGLTQSEIARRTGLQRKVVWRILEAYVEVRALSIRSGGGRGRTKLYDRGPTWAELERRNLTIGGVVPSPPISVSGAVVEPAEARIHGMRFKLPLFEEEMWYRDRDELLDSSKEPWAVRAPGPVEDADRERAPRLRRWTIGAWAGDYETWSACRVHGKDCFCPKSTTFYEFSETSGRWRLTFLKKAREVRTFGRKGRVAARKRVGTIVLMPRPVRAGPESLERDEELMFAAALDLMREIRENRRLFVDGIPEPIAKAEYGFEAEEHESFPPGKVAVVAEHVEPGTMWTDRSPGEGKVEVETNDRALARTLSITLPQVASAPSLPFVLEDIRMTLVRIERRLDDIEDRMGRR